ncbi:MAG: Rid family detoxifying hydrolase [Spirochaetia bacterium]|nr:Rid family detoxifying hydrolase [Spirochaetia bacterium]
MTKDIISTKNAPAPAGSYSQAVKSNGFIFVSGQIPIEPATGDLITTGIHHETRVVLDNISAILSAAGSDITKIVKLTVYLRKIEDVKFVNEVLAERFPDNNLPARACVEVSGLPKDAGVEIEAVAEA